MHYEGMIYRPPSEAYSLILQVTVGCAHNQCTFCSMYKDKQFHLKSLQDIEADLQEAQRFYGSRVERIFLADGDALVLSTEKLTEILTLCRSYFPSATRISSYGRAGDVLRKTPEELTALRRLEKDGLITSYWGTDDKSGGPRRRYYAITQAGRERLEQRLREWAEMRELMEMLLA